MSDENKTGGGGIARLAGMLGWLAVIGGLALVGYGLYLMFTSEAQNLAAIQMLSSGALTTAFGLIAILNATMAKAMVDTANNTARLLATGGASGAGAAATTTAAAATDDLPDFPATKTEPVASTSDSDDLPAEPSMDDGNEPDFPDVADTAPDIPSFEPAPTAPAIPPAPIVPDTSDPRLWPLAVDEFDLDGHLAMTLEDGSIAVETPEGWCRLPNMEDARSWLSQRG
jgi:hypothetical protein